MPWQRITPNEHHDWLNQRDKRYSQLVSLADEPGAIFHTGSNGLKTNRDAWGYNSSGATLRRNVGSMIDFYNDQVRAFSALIPLQLHRRAEASPHPSHPRRDRRRNRSADAPPPRRCTRHGR